MVHTICLLFFYRNGEMAPPRSSARTSPVTFLHPSPHPHPQFFLTVALLPSLFLSLLEPVRTSLKLLSSCLSFLSHRPDVILKPRTVLTIPVSCSSHLFLFKNLAHIPKHFCNLLFMHLNPKWSFLIFLNLSFNQQSYLPKMKI